MDQKVALIVGLGNPGPQYELTRHNAGADLVAALVYQHGGQFKVESKFHGLYAKVTLAGQVIHCLIPTTFMNRSGSSVAALTRFYKIPTEAILVAHDELDIAPGCIKLKAGGGHGGHNGLRDIIAHLGGSQFSRLRIGIGHPGSSSEVVNYVLNKAPTIERTWTEDAIHEALRQLPGIISGQWHKAQSILNGYDAQKASKAP